VKDYALFRVAGKIEGDRFIYDYDFNPLPAMKERVQARAERDVSCRLQKREGRQNRILDLRQHSIGPVDLQLYVFDREPQVLALGVTDKKGLKDFLDTVGGIRVYREGIRVYNYGEPGDDWLGLDGRRVNIPTARISNNLVIGAVSLDLAQSKDLVEKTNREASLTTLRSDCFMTPFSEQSNRLKRSDSRTSAASGRRTQGAGRVNLFWRTLVHCASWCRKKKG
jgi:hypothetical protein